MKRKNIVIIVSLLIILLTVISACTASVPTPTQTEEPTSVSDTEKIQELEEKILLLVQSQELSNSERKKQIEALEAEIKKLKEESTQTQTQNPEETSKPQIFKYTLENGKAVITSITSNDESITIPSSIDGYQVISVGSQALSSNSVKTVIISSGIEKLDWFAFSGCSSLSSVSIPDSVSSIGYGAFDNTAKALTIHCSRDSFAHKYAQSYGITYDIT